MPRRSPAHRRWDKAGWSLNAETKCLVLVDGFRGAGMGRFQPVRLDRAAQWLYGAATTGEDDERRPEEGI